MSKYLFHWTNSIIINPKKQKSDNLKPIVGQISAQEDCHRKLCPLKEDVILSKRTVLQNDVPPQYCGGRHFQDSPLD